MSRPKRYTATVIIEKPGERIRLSLCSDGEFVTYSDYAALAAENERLRSASFVTAVPSEEYERLKAENERLRKAGDELYKWAGAENRPPQQVYAAWNAAKEGAAK